MNNPKYYQIKINLGRYVKTIEMFAKHDIQEKGENWENYTFRINRLLFGKSIIKPYKILSYKVINENIGL
jgi:hypothetical protein